MRIITLFDKVKFIEVSYGYLINVDNIVDINYDGDDVILTMNNNGRFKLKRSVFEKFITSETESEK